MLLRLKRFCTSYTFLLISLFCFLLLPLLQSSFLMGIVMSATLSLVMISAVMNLYENKRLHLALWILSVPAVGVQWIHHLGLPPHIAATLAREIFSALFLGFTSLTIIVHLLEKKTVTPDTLAGAMSAYLLIGITFASAYLCLESVHPGSFVLSGGAGISTGSVSETVRSFLYFSFVTLTTVGFGDTVPISAGAKALTVVEAVCGQMYLAILIAVLVGKRYSGGGSE